MPSGAARLRHADPVQALQHARQGRLRILGICTGERLQATGDLPTMTEQGMQDGRHRLVGGDGAGGDAEAGRRPDQQVVRAGRRLGGHQEVPGAVRRRSAGRDAGGGAGALIKDVKDWGEYVKLAKIEPQG